MNKGTILTLIFIFVLVTYLPSLINPQLLLQRGNDLEEFFWPIIYFVKQQILTNHTIPFWNNVFLSGTPLLPDPQSPIFYLPNIIFLFLPLDLGFVISFLAHSFLGGVGMFLLGRHGFNFSSKTSLFMAVLYILTPKLIGHIEAGHFGLIQAYGWLPFVPLAIIKIIQKPKVGFILLLAISLSAIFFTHLPTLLLVALSSVVFFAILFILQKKVKKEAFLFFIVGCVLALGLTTISLIPQINWIKETTREMLLQNRSVYPLWNTKTEFIQSIFWPWNNIEQLNTEKWLTLGIFTILLGGFGFLLLKRVYKIIVIAILLLIILLTLNNLSPLYQYLISQDLFVQLRVSTRIWFIVNLIAILLAGFGLEKLFRLKISKIIIWLLIFASLIELLSLAWLRMLKPIPYRSQVPEEVYQFLKEDKDKFRVFCLTRCIPQKDAALYNLELVEGYSTLIQKNYYEYFIQLSQVFWDKYTLSLPPMEIYNFRRLQPHAPTLAEYNVKYVISTHPLQNPNFKLEKRFDQYLVYTNNLVKPRAYYLSPGPSSEEAKITHYSPNQIVVDTRNHPSSQLILAEVFSPGWKAYQNGKDEVTIKEHVNKLRLVDLEDDTKFVDFVYDPPGFKLGQKISLGTLFFVLIITFLYLFKRGDTLNNRA